MKTSASEEWCLAYLHVLPRSRWLHHSRAYQNAEHDRELPR